jgi:hypothetical protein
MWKTTYSARDAYLQKYITAQHITTRLLTAAKTAGRAWSCPVPQALEASQVCLTPRPACTLRLWGGLHALIQALAARTGCFCACGCL